MLGQNGKTEFLQGFAKSAKSAKVDRVTVGSW